MSKDEIIKQLQAERDLYKAKYEFAAQSYEDVLHQLRERNRAMFGSSSEKYMDLLSGQQALFEKAEFVTDNDDDDPDDDPNGGISVKGHQRKKKNHVSNYDHLPTRDEIIPVDNADRLCSCGCEKRLVGYEEKWLLHYVPAIFERILQKREKVSCPRCKDGITTAPTVLQLLPKSGITEELLAQVVINKCIDRQPLYHLEKIWLERFNVKVTRQTMANWIIWSAKKMTPLINLLKEEIVGYHLSSVDATSIQVLAEEGRKATTSSYMYCSRGGPPEKRSTIYDYNASKHKKFVQEWFEGFQGDVQSDAQDIFTNLDKVAGISVSLCNAHARRKFESISKTTPPDGLAHTAMRYFRRLYRIEAEAKNMSNDDRYKLRQEKSKPIMSEFHDWLTNSKEIVLPKTPLGRAIRYTLNHWNGLTRFLDNGELEIDNNSTEREIKPFVMARKNFLFSYSTDGAHALATYFSLIQTAKAHGVEPCQYLTFLFKQVPYCKSFEDYEALLPWNYAKTASHQLFVKAA